MNGLSLFPSKSKEPLWSRRGLIYPKQLSRPELTPPVWDRPGNRSPIYVVDPTPETSPLGNIPSSGLPIFVQGSPVSRESGLWEPSIFPSPVCPCCLPDHLAMPPVLADLPSSLPPLPPMLEPPPTPASPRITWARPTTSPSAERAREEEELREQEQLRQLKRKKSGVSLRLKKSFQSLRRLKTDDLGFVRRGSNDSQTPSSGGSIW
jgi:hypothetical protein